MAPEQETEVADAEDVTEAEVDRLVNNANDPFESNIVAAEEYNPDDAILPEYEDLDGGYEVAGNLVEKDELEKVPFRIYDFEFRIGTVAVAMKGEGSKQVHDMSVTVPYYGKHVKDDGELITEGPFREFVIARAVTAPGKLRKPSTEDESEHVVFTDGGDGIYKSLGKLFKARGVQKVNCRRGLRKSEYTGPHGGDSVTWYLS